MNEKLKELLDNEIEALRRIKPNAKLVEPVIEIDLSNYNEEIFKDLPSKGSTTIYIIKSKTELNISDIKKARQNLNEKENSKNFEISRINEDNEKDNKDTCLYVGRSDDIKTRLKQHLYLERKTTYAMRLMQLLQKGKITIEVYNFGKIAKEDNNAIQIFEDLLWKDYRPLLGRQGAK